MTSLVKKLVCTFSLLLTLSSMGTSQEDKNQRLSPKAELLSQASATGHSWGSGC